MQHHPLSYPCRNTEILFFGSSLTPQSAIKSSLGPSSSTRAALIWARMHAREKADETLPYFEPSLLTDLQMYVYINSARTSWRSGSEGRSLGMLLVPNISKVSQITNSHGPALLFLAQASISKEENNIYLEFLIIWLSIDGFQATCKLILRRAAASLQNKVTKHCWMIWSNPTCWQVCTIAMMWFQSPRNDQR